MLKSLSNSLHNAKNPFSRVKHRFPRYVLITACTGLLSFTAALILLHLGVPPLASLIASALASGLFSYGAMELWAFPHRKGRLSWRRLIKNALVGIGGFTARYAVLTLTLPLAFPEPFHKALPLILAHLASFVFGYVIRSRIIFHK